MIWLVYAQTFHLHIRPEDNYMLPMLSHGDIKRRIYMAHLLYELNSAPYKIQRVQKDIVASNNNVVCGICRMVKVNTKA